MNRIQLIKRLKMLRSSSVPGGWKNTEAKQRGGHAASFEAQENTHGIDWNSID